MAKKTTKATMKHRTDSVWSRMSPTERARWDSMDRADAAARAEANCRK
jgi:hypothetical protein